MFYSFRVGYQIVFDHAGILTRRGVLKRRRVDEIFEHTSRYLVI